MNDYLFGRVKSSLQKQYYIMNDSWLSDCIEYYLSDHENPTQDEIITFVINQWLLSDLREISNENGCLPTNLANQKTIILKGKYMLQMDKMYDISQSKYKQLEKIRNVHNENIEATENENARTEDKFQAWEPKSNRMLQLFLTDGIQNITAIEYKPIRTLKDSLFPGYKLLIKGPVVCRRGLILLEEFNIAEVGGEVESLLIVNAPENVFARAFNLEENPDPYNDNNKQTQNSHSNKKTNLMDDDFDIDIQAIDQIEKQINQQSSNSNQIATTSTRTNRNQNPESTKNINSQKITSLSKNNNKISITSNSNHSSNIGSISSFDNGKKAQKQNDKKSKIAFDDDDNDSFLEMIDENALKNISETKSTSTKAKSLSSKQSSPSTVVQKQKTDDFPTEDELNHFTDEYSPYFKDIQPLTKPLQSMISLSIKSSTSKTSSKNSLNSYNSNKSPVKNTISTSNRKESPSSSPSKKDSSKWKLPSPLKVDSRSYTNNLTNFPDDDFDLADIDMNDDDFKDNISSNKQSQSCNKVSQSLNSITKSAIADLNVEKLTNPINQTNLKDNTHSSSSKQLKSTSSSKSLDTCVQNNFKVNACEKNVGDSAGTRGVKRVAGSISSSPKKVSCSELPKVNNTTNPNTPILIQEDYPAVVDLISDVKKMKVKDKDINTAVRGKVLNIIKLSLLKDGNRPYFHLEGTITDTTAKLDIVFSSEVLEKVIGYSAQEFTQKRKQSKNDPAIKEQLREDLQKAQHILRNMDELMQIKLKKNEKALVVFTVKMSKQQKESLDARMKLL